MSYWSATLLLKYHLSAQVCRNVFSNLIKKINLTAIPPIFIPEYVQLNAKKRGRYKYSFPKITSMEYKPRAYF